MNWLKKKSTAAIEARAKVLADKLSHSMDRDIGYSTAWYMGVEPEVIAKMTDDELIRFGKSFKFKEPTHCEECGQPLPKE